LKYYYYHYVWLKNRTKMDLQKNLANDMFSKIDKSGTTKIPEPNLDAIPTRLYVSFPTVLSNGGGLKCGRPDSTWPGGNKTNVFQDDARSDENDLFLNYSRA